jgi:hypothetical protein
VKFVVVRDNMDEGVAAGGAFLSLCARSDHPVVLHTFWSDDSFHFKHNAVRRTADVLARTGTRAQTAISHHELHSQLIHSRRTVTDGFISFPRMGFAEPII